MIVSILVAKSKNDVIGKNNQLPWHLPADLKHFKNLTMGHHMIMGRKTFESIGKSLPGRTSVIITRQKDYKVPGCIVVNNIEDALKACVNDDEVFIIGGGEIFKETMNTADKIYLTEIGEEFEGDVFLPKIDLLKWKLTQKQTFKPDEQNKYSYCFCEYERVK